jgi:hypothetical protein
MTIKNPNCADEGRRDTEAARTPDSTPKTPSHCNPLVAVRGLWPGEIDDGFEEAIREMRDRDSVREPPSWW